jgi:hypothetical protein
MSRVHAGRRRTATRPRAPRPGAPPALNSAAQWVLGEMELWRPAFERGELAPSARDAPPLRSGERFAVQLPTVRAAGLGLPATAGSLFATDHRAVISGDRSRPPREWAHHDLCAVDLPSWQDAAGWLKVEAAFAAAAGRLDAWMGQLPQRLALVPRA